LAGTKVAANAADIDGRGGGQAWRQLILVPANAIKKLAVGSAFNRVHEQLRANQKPLKQITAAPAQSKVHNMWRTTDNRLWTAPRFDRTGSVAR
jgi:hypothetical protein